MFSLPLRTNVVCGPCFESVRQRLKLVPFSLRSESANAALPNWSSDSLSRLSFHPYPISSLRFPVLAWDQSATTFLSPSRAEISILIS